MPGRYLIVIEKAPANFAAYSPDVPGCIAVGGTVEETLLEMKDALRSHLGVMQADGDELPTPRGVESYLEATQASGVTEHYLAHVNSTDVLPRARRRQVA